MGADIHDYCEVRRNGKWEKVGDVFPNPYFHDDEQVDRRLCYVENAPDSYHYQENWHPIHQQLCNSDCYVDNARLINHPFDMRSYRVFGVLAGVRRDDYQPIHPPKGLPFDVTPEVKAASDGWGVDGHSHTWLSLAEMYAYNWQQTITHTGVVDLENYQLWKERGQPDEYCQSVGGGGTRMVNHYQMDRLLASGIHNNEDHTEVQWQETCAQSVEPLITNTMPRMARLIIPDLHWPQVEQFLLATIAGDKNALAVLERDWLPDHDLPSLNDVRLVCWFDN